MDISSFEKEQFMTTKVVFDDHQVKAGDIITLYRVTEGDTSVVPHVHGIVVEATPSSIKYSNWNEVSEEIVSNWLYSSEVYVSDSQWANASFLYIFTITPKGVN